MRITNKQKSELNEILKDLGLSKEQFDLSGVENIYQIKFKDNFFTFHIKKENEVNYINTITYINNKTPKAIRQNWQDTIKQFAHWAQGISEDIKHLPNSMHKAENDFPIEIQKYSKSFVEIYNQALTAEINELTEICGLGYRKAFEFLIKDYLIKKHPKTEHDKIKNMPLSHCINEYVTDDEIKLVGHRILWLGNDQAHYLKKWKGKTLSDLKNLISLTIQWILIKDELIQVEKSMPKGK